MAFIVKDLMITLVGERGKFGPNPGNVGGCLCSICSACTVTGIDQWMEVINPADLAGLKLRLRLALAGIEAREEALKNELRPQSLEEAEALEEQLKGALEELRRIKTELKESAEGA